MKYDSFDDVFYFILGASISSGSIFWLGKQGRFNKGLKEQLAEESQTPTPEIRQNPKVLNIQHIKTKTGEFMRISKDKS